MQLDVYMLIITISLILRFCFCAKAIFPTPNLPQKSTDYFFKFDQTVNNFIPLV